MFITKRECERKISHLQTDIQAVRNMYYELHRSHYALLNHLGLRENNISAHMVIEPQTTPASGAQNNIKKAACTDG